jgi:hypothetical protein
MNFLMVKDTPYNRLSGQQMLSGTQIISTSHGMTGRNDVAYGIGAIKRNVKNVAVFFPDITSKTLKLRQVPVWTFC